MEKIKYLCQLFSLIIISLSITGGSPTFAHGVEGEPLPSGIVIGDDKGIHVQSDGEYLVEIKDVLPGKKWTIDIDLMSVDKGEAYDLSMQIFKPTLSGPIDFSKAIHMVLNYAGKKIYDGPASGISDTINLQEVEYSFGTFHPGDSKRLRAVFEMDHTYTKNDFQVKSMMENVWKFRATKNQELERTEDNKQTKRKLFFPQTGEEWRNVLIYISLGLFIVLMAVLIFKKKYEDQKKRS
ncbi:LPXTG cell wall anchor domain-containing protein [Enterococcus rotai]|uniref:LPXTG cell wall anchor domain-containing protein n=1 Tax=Enterococcus rotai TaxID=118060 RepID=UPI0035C755FE